MSKSKNVKFHPKSAKIPEKSRESSFFLIFSKFLHFSSFFQRWIDETLFL